MKNSFYLSTIITLLISSLSTARPIQGTYEVPVDKSLKSSATYPVKFNADKDYQDVPTKLNFPLPATLIGEEQWFSMSQLEPQSNQWAGDNVAGECSLVGRYFECKMKFENLNIDLNKVQEQINNSYTTEEQVNKMSVSMKFEHESIGVLRYKLKGKVKNR